MSGVRPVRAAARAARRGALIAVAACALALAARAQLALDVSCGCDALLVPAVPTALGESESRLAALRILDQPDFERLREKRTAGWRSALLGELLDADDYAAFDAARAAELSAAGYARSADEARNLLLAVLPAEAGLAWSSCRMRCQASEPGLHTAVVAIDEHVVRVACRWRPPAGGTGVGVVTSSELSGGARSEATVAPGKVATVGTEIPREAARVLTFHRERGQPLRARVTVNRKYGATLDVPWTDAPKAGPTTRGAPVRLAQVDFGDLSLHTCAHCRDEGGARFHLAVFARAVREGRHEPRASTGDLTREFTALPVAHSEARYPVDKTFVVDLEPGDEQLAITGSLYSSGAGYASAPPTEFTLVLEQRHGRWQGAGPGQVRQLSGAFGGRTCWRAALGYEVTYIAY